MELQEAITARYSCRSFTERAIDSALLKTCVGNRGAGTIRMQLAALEISHHPRPGHGSPDTALYKACSFYRC